MYRQEKIWNLPDSAVNVFPTPGGPLKRMMIPLPLPSMTSSNWVRTDCLTEVKPKIKSFWFLGKLRLLNAFSLKLMFCDTKTVSTYVRGQ